LYIPDAIGGARGAAVADAAALDLTSALRGAREVGSGWSARRFGAWSGRALEQQASEKGERSRRPVRIKMERRDTGLTGSR
jgi:hypothetical protein